MLGFVLAIGYGPTLLHLVDEPAPAPAPAPTATHDAAPSDDLGPLLGPYVVTDVVDGTTLRARRDGTSTTVRLLGIDTPSSSSGSPPGCVEVATLATARSMLLGQTVFLRADPIQDPTDPAGRTVAYVYVERALINQVLLQGGFAVEYTSTGPYRYQERFQLAEAAAREAHLGIWAANSCTGRLDLPDHHGGTAPSRSP